MKSAQITNHRNYSIDGCLPDIDYSLMTMKNLDDLDSDKVLMEYEYVHVKRSDHSSNSGFNITLTSNSRENIRIQHHEDVFIKTLNSNANSSLNKNELINKNYAKHQIIQQSHSFPQLVYTTPDRLQQTIWLQQVLFREKLNLLSNINCITDNNNENNNQLNTQYAIEKHIEDDNVVNSTSNVNLAMNNTVPNSWRIKRSSDGTRYITKKYTRPSNIFNCKSFQLNMNDQNENDQNHCINSTCSNLLEKKPISGIYSTSSTNLQHVTNHHKHHHRHHHHHLNNTSNVNSLTCTDSDAKPKFQNVGILKHNNSSFNSIQTNIPTSLLLKPPIQFRRSQSTSVSRNTCVHFDIDKNNTKFSKLHSHDSMLCNYKSSNRMKSNSYQTSMSVVTI
ncbi:hypothetical protein EWB00_005589 [Schistosoma japonicum]|uniref:Uncharacterized protein n=1 Tax=Schistosoma japonicum TaxID=6182 RepID=A0A4Z2D1B8_SCHJA|nr:hypothetical protein EWB00_005589 [Schistosoma japonicum]